MVNAIQNTCDIFLLLEVRIEFYREGQSSNNLKFEFQFTQQVSPIDPFGKMVQAVTHK